MKGGDSRWDRRKAKVEKVAAAKKSKPKVGPGAAGVRIILPPNKRHKSKKDYDRVKEKSTDDTKSAELP